MDDADEAKLTADSVTPDAPPVAAHRRRAFRVAGVFAGVGMLLGLLWALAAPPEQVAALGDGRALVLTGESDHRFDAVALFLLITAAAGVVVTVGVWAAVPTRGPRLAVETVVSALLGSAVAAGVGIAISAVLNGSADGATSGDVVSLAPGLSTPLVVIAQPLAAAVTLVMLAAMSSSDDLSRSGSQTSNHADFESRGL
ncbi:MAG: DUF2567 domain-containing protein [Rhodococcus sp. (in: high G+C Gram-positive bacteria)]